MPAMSAGTAFVTTPTRPAALAALERQRCAETAAPHIKGNDSHDRDGPEAVPLR
jgi:hypothetical protein